MSSQRCNSCTTRHFSRNLREKLDAAIMELLAGDGLSRNTQCRTTGMPFWHKGGFQSAALPKRSVSCRAWAMFLRVLLVSLALVACGASTRAKRRVDGSYAVDCNSQKACLDRADKLCGETGYSIVGGRHDQKLYGVPGNQKVVGKDELYIVCKSDVPSDAPDPAAGSWKLARPDAGGIAQGHSPPPKNTVCRPGETQRCIGAGACEGGQACAPDGTRYGPCDCGEPSSRRSTLSASPIDAGAR